SEQLPRRTFLLCFALAALVISRNFTFEILHPDNLHLLHATGTLLLCLLTCRQQRYSLALLSVTFASCGVLAKQTAGFTTIGATVSLLALLGRRWGLWRSALLVAVAALVTGLAATPLMLARSSRYFTWWVVQHHPIEWSKVEWAFRDHFAA